MEKISSQFYARVLRILTTTAPERRYWTICKLILQQAMQQLNPLGLNMVMAIIICTEPLSERNIHSLRVSIGQGVLPGVEEGNLFSAFLGAESFSGYAAICGHQIAIQNLCVDQHLYYPMHNLRAVRSIVATPIRRMDAVAGCFSIYSAQPGYFSPDRQQLAQKYADLLALAFEPRAFYESSRIELGVIPAHQFQIPYLASFQQRLAITLKEAAYLQLSISMQTAKLMVWQQIESDLLRLAYKVSAQRVLKAGSALQEFLQ